MNKQNTSHADAEPIRYYPISILSPQHLKELRWQNKCAHQELRGAFRHLEHIHPETLSPLSNVLDATRACMEDGKLFAGQFRWLAGMILHYVKSSTIETNYDAKVEVISCLNQAEGHAKQIEWLLDPKNNDKIYWCPDLDMDLETAISTK